MWQKGAFAALSALFHSFYHFGRSAETLLNFQPVFVTELLWSCTPRQCPSTISGAKFDYHICITKGTFWFLPSLARTEPATMHTIPIHVKREGELDGWMDGCSLASLGSYVVTQSRAAAAALWSFFSFLPPRTT